MPTPDGRADRSRSRPRAAALRSLRHPAYRRWTAASLVSVAGTWMQLVAQNWVMLRETGSGGMLGLTVAVQALPGLVLGLWAGAVVDRVDPRRVLVATQAALGVLAAVLALVLASGRASAPLLLLLGLATGLVGVFDGPASGALAASFLPEVDLGNGLALSGLVSAIGRVGGMAAAGLVVAALGPAMACGLNALSYGAPLAVLAGLPRRPATAAPPPDRGGVREGLRHVAARPEVAATLAVAWVLGCAGRSFQVTMALMAERTFHAGAGLYGTCSSAFAIGAVAGGAIAARLPHLTRRVLVLSAAVAAGGQVLSGLARGPITFVALMVPVGAGAVVLDTTVTTRVLLGTGAAVRGRVLALCGVVGGTAGLIGAPLLGAVGQHLGPRMPLVAGGLVALAAIATFHRRQELAPALA